MKRPRLRKERLEFERRIMQEFADLEATPEELNTVRDLLRRGRKPVGISYVAALNLAASERAGIEYVRRCLSGDPPLAVIVRMNPCPEVQSNG